MKKITKLIFVIGFFALITNTRAQVGIGIADPDTAAVLQIHSNDKGVLFPRISNHSFLDNVTGLFFYATDDNKFYFYNGTEWQCVNPLNSSTPNVIKESFTVQNGDVTLQGGDLIVEPQNTINGYGTIPIRGIIMWSGSIASIPDGWALCNYQIANGIQTPDLRGKFVVGHHPGVTAYNTPGKTGGRNNNSLTASNIPNHRHGAGTLYAVSGGNHSHLRRGYRNISNGKGGNRVLPSVNRIATDPLIYGGEAAGAHTHTVSGNTGYWGATTVTAVENRPPYYVIAYIMRVK